MKLLGDWIEHHGPARVAVAMGRGIGHGKGRAQAMRPDILNQTEGDDDTPPAGGDKPASSGDVPGGSGDKPAGRPGDTPPPRNPWAPDAPSGSRRPAGIEDIFRQRRPGGNGGGNPGGGGGGGGSGLPPRMPGPDLSNLLRLPRRQNGGSWWPIISGGLVTLGLVLSATHQLGLHDQGIVTTFGQYSRTLQPGFNMTLPWPFQDVTVTDVTTIKQEAVPSGEADNLMLTSDQSLVNISYVVRWSIRDLKLYSYQLKDPESTVTEVAEAAMRATIAEVKLSDVMGGTSSSEIGEHVRQRMQAVLDAYHSGVQIQGVDLKKADPPSKVNEAFQKVQAAQQDRNRYIQQARGYAQQTIARAEGEAGAFDRVYTQYKAAPEVTRRRMYYETMDRVLSSNDKVILPTGPATYLPLPPIRQPAPPMPDAQGVPAQGGGQ
ncbi:MAG: protease modulator HflK [Sphingomonadales bacterium]|nr:protease modulator HflK [Sphingomonadales bacterium]MDE2168837.1 protease modulator HflK [Sphingomonadales bacterium]